MSKRRINEWAAEEGTPTLFGVSWIEGEGSYNFALYTKHATGVTLLLYSNTDLVHPLFQYRLDPLKNKSGRVWHCRIAEKILAGATYYGYSVDGPFKPAEGHRDDLRAFMRGDPGNINNLMARLYGSRDLFADEESYHAYQSVNFITSHDGFTLYDLVSYNEKHNEANGHRNTDGTDDNLSWNCGWEGDPEAPEAVLDLRRCQVKNFFALLFLANGTPMFRAGDEFLQTQGGNNNPYNQDNETSWLDWNLLQKNREIFRFFKQMIAFSKAHPTLCRSRFWREAVRWYGAQGEVDRSENSRCLAFF